MKKRLAIIGSTGSIGTQALEVVRLNPDEFEVTALAALKNADALEKQVREFNPSVAVLKDPPKDFVPEKSHAQWGFGSKARDEICELECVDSVLVCVVGMDGLSCVINAIKHRKQVLLANKETLMTGGDIVMSLAKEYSVEIIPVDSEHTAIYQCLKGERKHDVEKLLLTASGGPFRTWKKEDIYNATLKDALKHPNWSMGQKITVDSAGMMNKCIEVVEAHHLFDMPADKIQVVVHPQSILHSAVEFKDGSVIGHMSVPDMRNPILYAMADGKRLNSGIKKLSLFDMPQLTFEPCDTDKFPCMLLAYEGLKLGGNACAVINAANEQAVDAFIKGKIVFGKIYEIINSTLEHLFVPGRKNYDEVMFYDHSAREFASSIIDQEYK